MAAAVSDEHQLCVWLLSSILGKLLGYAFAVACRALSRLLSFRHTC